MDLFRERGKFRMWNLWEDFTIWEFGRDLWPHRGHFGLQLTSVWSAAAGMYLQLPIMQTHEAAAGC